ncbi:MAG: hypothetical protein HRT88_02630 [Lentisphaeraceae bacterium]|nr:hypothetical protein [Lentisphaeraceae bacterium]
MPNKKYYPPKCHIESLYFTESPKNVNNAGFWLMKILILATSFNDEEILDLVTMARVTNFE